LNKIQFDSITFQERNEICGMEPERSGWNLTEKSGTERDLKWDENCSFFELIWNVSVIPGETEWNWQPWLKPILGMETFEENSIY